MNHKRTLIITKRGEDVDLSSAKVNLHVLGLFRVVGSKGADCTPRGRKSCAILAMLALSKDCRRSRKWIQDKLWSDRAHQQGSASVRQSLAEIRRQLGPDRNCLQSDHQAVWLDRDCITVDLDTHETAADGIATDGVELLEGFDIRDPEFEDWLRQQRRQFHSRKEQAPDLSGDSGEPVPLATTEKGPRSPHLILSRANSDGTAASVVLADSFLDSIAKTVSELGFAEIIDCRGDSLASPASNRQASAAKSIEVHSDIAKSNDRHIFRVVLCEHPVNKILWSNTIESKNNSPLRITDRHVLNYVNQLTNVTVDQFIRQHSEDTNCLNPTLLCHAGIQSLYRFGNGNFTNADDLFARAFELQPHGIYLAWRALLRTFLLAERQYSCRNTLEEEAFYFMHKSLEMEPHNSFVAGFSAHVHAIMRRSHAAAYEMAERSIQLNRANPYGWVGLGLAKCHLGKPDEGFRNTLKAREMAGTAPYRYHLDGLSCIAGVMAGDFESATLCGEASHANAPEFAPPLRYLSALYLHAGQHDRSRQMVEKLETLEQGFSLEHLKDEAYPAAGLQRSGLLKALPTREL